MRLSVARFERASLHPLGLLEVAEALRSAPDDDDGLILGHGLDVVLVVDPASART